MHNKYRVIIPTILVTFLVGCSNASSEGPKFDSSLSVDEVEEWFDAAVKDYSNENRRISEKEVGGNIDKIQKFYKYLYEDTGKSDTEIENEITPILFDTWDGMTFKEIEENARENAKIAKEVERPIRDIVQLYKFLNEDTGKSRTEIENEIKSMIVERFDGMSLREIDEYLREEMQELFDKMS